MGVSWGLLVGAPMYRGIHLNLQVQENEKYQFLREVHQSGEIEYVQEED